MSVSKGYCVGCGVCYSSCSIGAIKMNEDKMGFYSPVIDIDSCIHCNTCVRVCPENQEYGEHEVRCYAVQNSNEGIRLNSTSGGVFSVLASKTLKANGVVFGAKYNLEFHPVIEGCDSYDELIKFSGAKYIQSIAWKSFKLVKKMIDEGKLVMYTALPCQIAALKNFLNQDYDNLIYVEVACHGVPSVKMFDSYIKELKFKHNSCGNLVNYSFRYKFLSPKKKGGGES